MTLVLTVNGEDLTSSLQEGSLYVEHRAESFASIAGFLLGTDDDTISIPSATGTESLVTIVDGATTFFSGRVTDVTETPYVNSTTRFIDIRCQDLNWQLSETVVDSEESYTATSDYDIIQSLFDRFLPAVDTETYVDTISASLTINVGPCTLRQALTQLSTRSGAYWYIDFDNKLHYFTSESDAVAWSLSDEPDDVDSFAYFDTPRKELRSTTRLDGVFVLGAGASGWVGDHDPGDRTAIVIDNRITTSTGVTERGTALLNQYGNSQVTYVLETYKGGLIAGQDVGFKCDLYSVNTTLTAHRVTTRWDSSGTAYYEMVLGDRVNPALTGERLWLDSVEQSLGPIVAPRLPVSSRGWTNGLSFSATDEDTVAWTSGSIYLADGTEYSIDAGNTGNMAAITYVYLDIDSSTTVLQTTTDVSVAVGANKLLVCVAVNVAAGKDATFKVFGGDELALIVGDNITAGTITGNEIAANTIEAGNIAAGTITANEIDTYTITADRLNMGTGVSPFNAADGLLLLNDHSEISVSEWWSLRRQKADLTGAFQHVLGRWNGTRSLKINPGAVNTITNPSFETGTTSWSENDTATFEQSADFQRFGDYSLKMIGSAATAYTEYSLSGFTPNATITVSAWVRASSTSVNLYGTGGSSDTDAHNGSGDWDYLFVVFNVDGSGEGTVRIRDTRSSGWDAVYIDGVQAEETPYPTPYFDGSFGYGFSWGGTAHASASTRVVTEVNLDDNVALVADRNVMSFRVMVQAPIAHDDHWVNGTDNYIFDLNDDDTQQIALAYNPAEGTGVFEVLIGGTAYLQSSEQTFEQYDWLDLVVLLDFTNDEYYLYLDGELEDSATDSLSAQTVTQWNLGSDYEGAKQCGWAISEYALFGSALTAAEIAALHAYETSLVDIGAYDSQGIYILDGRFKIASTTSGNRIDLTPDEMAGYNGSGVKQFYLQASDGAAYAGAGDVRLDADGIALTAIEDAATAFMTWEYDDSGTIRYPAIIAAEYYTAGSTAILFLKAAQDTGWPWDDSQVTLEAENEDADVRLNVNSNGTVDATNCTTFQVNDGVANIFVLSGGDLALQLGDAAGSNKFSVKDSSGGEVAYIDSDGQADFYHIAVGSDASVSATTTVLVQDEVTATSGSYFAQFFNVSFNPGSNFSTTITGTYGGVVLESAHSRTGGILYGIQGRVIVQNGIDARDLVMYGAYLFTDVEDAGSGGGAGAAAAYGAFIETPRVDTGTCTNGFGLRVAQGTVGTGSITSLYGIYVEGVDEGSTNYAIYTNAGTVRFGDMIDAQAANEVLRLRSTGATGNPYISFYQTTTRRSFIQHNDTNDQLLIKSEYGDVVILTPYGTVCTFNDGGTVNFASDIITATTITTHDGFAWDLGGTASGTITPDYKIHVTIDGDIYTIAAQEGLH